MAKLPPVNARVTLVERFERVSDGGGGFTEAWVQTWAGNEPAFSTEKISLEAGASSVLTVHVVQVVVPSTVPVAVGDRVTWTHAGKVNVRAVDGTEDRADYGFTRLYVKENA
jgi:plastocyanin